MGGEAPVELRTPSESNIIMGLMMGGRDVQYTIDLRERKEPVFQEVVASDKGRYVRAVIDLFGGLFSASHFFENVFWREVVEFLCRRGSVEADALERVRAKLQKRRHAIRDQIEQGRVDLLAKYVMDLARVEHVREHDVTFQWLRDQCATRIAALNEKLRADPKRQETEVSLDETIKDLGRRLQDLTELGVFRQGVGMTCQTCGSRQWRAVDSLRQRMLCEGCGGDLPMPAERSWSYRLNTLVRNAVGLHGALPVIWVLGDLRRTAFGSFIGEPGVALYSRWGDEVAAAEVDIVCVRGAKLWIGEVKTNSAEFAADDLDRLADVAHNVSADTAFVAAFDNRSKALERHAAALRDRLKARGAECGVDTIAPPDYVFEWSGTLF